MDAFDGDRLLRRKEVAAMLGIGRHTLARLIRSDPTFPRFFDISRGISKVRAREVSRWIQEKELQARERNSPGSN